MTKILGQAEATAEQMAAYLLSVNPSPKISVPPLELCRMYLEQGAKEGVRGDALFAQSCKETGNFTFSGIVSPGQNNFAGLGAVDGSTAGACFATPQIGILAQAQHARGYATAAGLSCGCVDPRYHLLERYGKTGTAEHWEELSGKWAVPGFNTKRYGSLEEADAAGDSYGYQIIKILNKILKMPKEEKTTMGKKPIIALDAGHGMGTAGKRCLKSLDPNQTREWYLNDRIIDQVEAELQRCYHCTVLRVDDTTGVKDISLSARVKAANAAGADIYISMHHNAGLSGRAGGGTVVYFCSSKSERPAQARILYNAIISRTGLRGNRSQQVINKGFYVIKNTKMPSFLIENGFMDSPDDVPVILSAQHATKTAEGVIAFLVDMMQLQMAQSNSITTGATASVSISTGSTSASSGSSTYYPAYTGKKTTLSAAMTSLGINSTYSYRKQIAAANDIKGYTGTASQNTLMYNMLAAGLLKRV